MVFELPTKASRVVYNPDQDPSECRDIRNQYRNLEEEIGVVVECHKSTDVMAEHVNQSLDKANDIFKRVQRTGEAILDSGLLKKTSQRVITLAHAIKSSSVAFDVDDYIAKLVIFMGGRRGVKEPSEHEGDYEDDYDGGDTLLDWRRIGWKAMAKSHRALVTDFMIGPLSIEQRTRNVRTRSKLEKHQRDRQVPQAIVEGDIDRSTNETSNNVEVIENILEHRGKINVFRFVINPNDFGQSVENLFCLSFLIRDGKCALDIENGEPIVYTCEGPTQMDYDAEVRKRQVVMELDMATWKRAIEVFEIHESIIPQRPQWHG